MLVFKRVSEAFFSIDGVVISAAFLTDFQDLVCYEFGEDSLDRSLSNSDLIREIPDPGVGIPRQAHDDVEVVCQKGPLRGA